MIDRIDTTDKGLPTSEATNAGALPGKQEIIQFLDTVSDLPRAASRAARAGGNLITILQAVQEHFGYLPANALEEIARRTRTPLSRVYAVVSFYTQLYTEPRGKHTVHCCRGTACHVKGADRVIDMIRRTLGIDDGQTTPDMMFYFETIACLGTCFLAPVMMIDGEYYGKLTPQSVERILAGYRTQAGKKD
ncbi:MAG: NADH-quinone oxidoreductase subunit NuoE [Planctomycetes bacterium]|nr:NADH-quinone oxidoreductase subunit NuoE [Planctomycetota bacterium]